MSAKGEAHGSVATVGRTIHWAGFYDRLVAFVFGGREAELRRRIVTLCDLPAGARVLDVGCGTGTLALEAKRHFSPGTEVFGVDPAQEMVTRAKDKAAAAELSVDFRTGVVEQLDFEDESFDLVFATLMIHHLTPEILPAAMREVARVLKPGGRFVLVDLESQAGTIKERFTDFIVLLHGGHRRCADVVSGQVPLLQSLGIQAEDQGRLNRELAYLIARKSESSAVRPSPGS